MLATPLVEPAAGLALPLLRAAARPPGPSTATRMPRFGSSEALRLDAHTQEVTPAAHFWASPACWHAPCIPARRRKCFAVCRRPASIPRVRARPLWVGLFAFRSGRPGPREDRSRRAILPPIVAARHSSVACDVENVTSPARHSRPPGRKRDLRTRGSCKKCVPSTDSIEPDPLQRAMEPRGARPVTRSPACQ